jgi:hypothetical protein
MISTRQNLVLTCWQALYQQGNPFELYYKSKGEKCVLKKGLKALEELTLMRENFVRQIPPSKKAHIWGVPACAATISALDLPVALSPAVDETRRKLYPSW